MSETPTPEDQAKLHFIPYPPIEQLAVVGDRRTACAVAADGTVSWLCLPRFDGVPVFGAILDLKSGGYWRLGPEAREFGEQSYATALGVLELTECMLWPQTEREPALEPRRVVVRRLRCVSGRRTFAHRIEPREDYRMPVAASPEGEVLRLQLRAFDLGLWTSQPLDVFKSQDGAEVVGELARGEEVWAVLDSFAEASSWTAASAEAALKETTDYWRKWAGSLKAKGSRADEIRVAAAMAHLCTYAPTGAIIAAPTSSLPERVPGEYNYDYRYCWVRDGALVASLLCDLGDLTSVERFLDFVAGRFDPDAKKLPIETLYRVDGGRQTPKDQREDIAGYRDCQPVRMGNPVFQMYEIDGVGFLIDCIAKLVQATGAVKDAHWTLVEGLADYIADNWREKDAGTWELMPFQHFVVSKVMCWVTLDRALRICEATGRPAPSNWERVRQAIHHDVSAKGWSEAAGSFRQRYDSEALDATALLIPLMGFLPPDDPRVRRTVKTLDKALKLNGLIHRFVPERTPGRPDQPMGDKEGAFLMCAFWLAHAWALLGETDKAEAALARAEACRGPSRIFSEAADARHTPGLLGNTPLLFSEAAYAQAIRAMGQAA